MDIPKFVKLNETKYNDLSVKDKDTIYFIIDAKEIRLGADRYVPNRLNPAYAYYVYLSPTGDNNNGGTTTSSPMKTIGAAIAKYWHCHNLVLKLSDGIYNEESSVNITINGSLTISSLSGDKTKVIIKHDLDIRNGIFTLSNITINSISEICQLWLRQTNATISSCIIIGKDYNAYNTSGLNIFNSTVSIKNIQISNSFVAIRANDNSIVSCFSINPSIVGQENTFLYTATTGSTIYKPNGIPIASLNYEVYQLDIDSLCIKLDQKNLANILNPNLTPLSVYLSPNGNDNKDGLSLSNPMKTFSRVLTKYGHYPGLYLILLDGNYNSSPQINICTTGFLSIYSYSHNNSKVIITAVMDLKRGYINLSDITIINPTSSAATITIGSAKTKIEGCVINGNDKNSKNGIDAYNSEVVIKYTKFSNCSSAIRAVDNSSIYVTDCVATTAGNMVAFRAESGSTIVKNGTIPSIEYGIGVEDQVMTKGIIR